jgi:hypothetical protein
VNNFFPPKQSADESSVGITKDCNPMDEQMTFVGRIPKDPNPT